MKWRSFDEATQVTSKKLHISTNILKCYRKGKKYRNVFENGKNGAGEPKNRKKKSRKNPKLMSKIQGPGGTCLNPSGVDIMPVSQLL